MLWVIHDHGGPSKSEWIGFGSQAAEPRQDGEKRPNRAGESVRAKIRAECGQSLLPMPEAEVLAGVKGPCDGSGSALSGPGNQRAWMSGVEAEECYISARSCPRFTISKTPTHGLRCNRWLAALWSDGVTIKIVSQGSVDSFVIRKHQREIVSQTNSLRLGGYA